MVQGAVTAVPHDRAETNRKIDNDALDGDEFVRKAHLYGGIEYLTAIEFLDHALHVDAAETSSDYAARQAIPGSEYHGLVIESNVRDEVAVEGLEPNDPCASFSADERIPLARGVDRQLGHGDPCHQEVHGPAVLMHAMAHAHGTGRVYPNFPDPLLANEIQTIRTRVLLTGRQLHW